MLSTKYLNYIYNFPGDDCTTSLIERSVLEVKETSSGSIVAGVFVALIVIISVVLIILYYRRRVKSLKNEIANVHYIADPDQDSGSILLHLLFICFFTKKLRLDHCPRTLREVSAKMDC